MRTDKEPIYPVEPWEVTETAFFKKETARGDNGFSAIERNNYRNETTFALSNGYIGTRGTFEEAYDFDIDTGLEGNFINGFYESGRIRYGEANFGSPLRSQSLLNLPNLKETLLYADGEQFRMDEGTVTEYARTLRMKEGTLERSLIWTSPGGRRIRIRIGRLVSFEKRHILAIRYEAEPLNFDGELTFVSRLQADVENHTRKTNPIVDYGPFGRRLEPLRLTAEERRLYYEGITKGSRLTMGCGSSHRLWLDGKPAGARESYETGELEASVSLTLAVRKGETAALEKMICYLDGEVSMRRAEELLAEAEATGYGGLKERQRACMDHFWETAGIDIEGAGADALRQGLHFNLFHIFQSAGRDGRTGMGAKGLSGEGYEGHYFWDTEMYVMPVFIYTEPGVAKALLDYRYAKLPEARDRARVLGHDKGALFPWRTINGEEASTYYPLGTAQYHINGDIAYALCLYFQVTGDVEYLKEKGAELLIETARVWADVGSFAECRGGKYCICSVTGPDEYNVLVDNNFYTNLTARENLRNASRAVRYLREHAPERMEELERRLDFSQEETVLWDRIAENMYFPYDEKRGIYPMDDGFLMRKPWDESKIPPEKRAWLYENYHPLFIMRHRMSKQADAVLGMYLYGNYFTEEEIRRNYDFYQEVTLHHSSLSTCIFGIVASGIGYREEAYRYFSQSARMDLDDYHDNFYAGIHAANMAGTWQAVINGFAGVRCQDSGLSFRPYLPEDWDAYAFCLRYRGRRLRVRIERERAEFTLLEGERIEFWINGRRAAIEQEGGSFVEAL
ncbi:MAG: glycosyl hydrolase family 65 protein [Eubacteriales bacterium]|nr:glycosyl hydrolase family 65 protein [Eubacteriales bacterium]